MKGITFCRPLEYCLETKEESWCQGDKVQGSLQVKNHGNEAIELAGLKVELAYGTFKKVHAKAADSFECLDSVVFDNGVKLEGQQERRFDWQFSIPEDGAITDTIGSLYLRYGMKDLPGQLQLNVSVKPVMMEYLETFENFFRFKIGPMKYKKGLVEVKMIPPKSKEFGSVEGLTCLLRLENDDLQVKYNFKTKNLGATLEGDVKVQKKVKEFQQTIGPKQYHQFGATNYDQLKSLIGEILKQVVPKILY